VDSKGNVYALLLAVWRSHDIATKKATTFRFRRPAPYGEGIDPSDNICSLSERRKLARSHEDNTWTEFIPGLLQLPRPASAQGNI
jgi:hypothetical protein